MIMPTGNTGVVWLKFCQLKNASVGAWSPVGMPPLADHDAGEAVGIRGDEPQADEAAPVLAHERDVVEVDAPRATPTSSRRGVAYV